jgi:hypothetical protein
VRGRESRGERGERDSKKTAERQRRERERERKRERERERDNDKSINLIEYSQHEFINQSIAKLKN